MSDKTSGSGSTCFALPGWSAVTLRGEQATAFAQAQFMGDLSDLAPGRWQWNGWLTPKGRLVALFALLALDGRDLALLLPDADPEAFVAALTRFRFRTRVEIAHEGGWSFAGRFSAPEAARGAAASGSVDGGGLELDFGGDGGPRTLRIAASPVPADEAQAARWRREDLAHGLPRLAPGQAEQWTPQQLSLERLRAFSVHKGCYPGQEIVARTHFLGQAKRGLVRLAGDQTLAVAPVAAVDAPGRALGQVVSVAGDQALAVMPLDAGDGPFHVQGVACTPLPLLDGLAR
ncbi:YgfZ/GcvT domain-containing protein [Luteimonas wenzhouensis]|jgi:folate-binding protein YgfZ|uniref:Folate-binding protein YgfZ n=1 Tax=Luteimonas wenzhouensis TaxID=2599615 RepID=A0A5C5U8Q5_9GAMM|nr:folate-binding protein YgfZ [Luteimonas wenzhouensis]TWT21780.1 folate-binding protein YgfZ [Luteimonas wenzhouensis]